MLAYALLIAAQAAMPAALKPEGPWTLDNNGGCVLSRRFAGPDGPITFGLRPRIGEPGGELVLVLPGRGGRYEVDEGKITLDDGTASFAAIWSRVGRRDQTFNGVTIQPADGFWNALPAARRVTMDVGKRQQVSLDLGAMASAMAVLDDCRTAKGAALASSRRR